jgi:short-subunit dehydrogenase
MGAAPLLHTDPDKLTSLFDVNLIGPLRMVQAFTPLLLSTTETPENKQAKIVNIGSVISGGAPWHTAYGSSKVCGGYKSSLLMQGCFTSNERYHAKRVCSFGYTSYHH